MNDIFKEFGKSIAKYDEQYEGLFIELARKGSLGGDTEILGYSFETKYEFYLYCFFIGLYNEQRSSSGSRKNNFSHPIEKWGSKSGGRHSFEIIQNYIFIACFNHTDDIDIIALEKGEIEVSSIINKMMLTLEEYTNGGLQLLTEKKESEPNYFNGKTGFLDFILN
ncbi:hypothetical protein VSP20_03430 [Myroides phaeus]|uniref:hypothetical protein n=1 Tax=Myroides phaeus TaxID=702745 RepID=UPI002DB77B22|nr:hypothetical protein [Myroides phaeus]MEC4116014.1 hypothetical protein [Myroides phaeus]